MAALIAFVLGNFTLTFLVLGIVAGLIAAARAPGGITRANLAEGLLAYFILFTIAIAYFYNFVFHVFFGEMAARFIGWSDSPFQLEVGTASLGFAAVGFLAAFRSFDLRVAAILGPGLFCLGAAVGHIHQMITAHNFAPGNAGVIFWMDILLPLFGAVLLWLSHNTSGHGGVGLLPQTA